MTVKQKQCLLEYFGYSPNGIDGVEGENTKRAMVMFAIDHGCDVSEVAVTLPSGRANTIKVEVSAE